MYLLIPLWQSSLLLKEIAFRHKKWMSPRRSLRNFALALDFGRETPSSRCKKCVERRVVKSYRSKLCRSSKGSTGTGWQHTWQQPSPFGSNFLIQIRWLCNWSPKGGYSPQGKKEQSLHGCSEYPILRKLLFGLAGHVLLLEASGEEVLQGYLSSHPDDAQAICHHAFPPLPFETPVKQMLWLSHVGWLGPGDSSLGTAICTAAQTWSSRWGTKKATWGWSWVVRKLFWLLPRF